MQTTDIHSGRCCKPVVFFIPHRHRRSTPWHPFCTYYKALISHFSMRHNTCRSKSEKPKPNGASSTHGAFCFVLHDPVPPAAACAALLAAASSAAALSSGSVRLRNTWQGKGEVGGGSNWGGAAQGKGGVAGVEAGHMVVVVVCVAGGTGGGRGRWSGWLWWWSHPSCVYCALCGAVGWQSVVLLGGRMVLRPAPCSCFHPCAPLPPPPHLHGIPSPPSSLLTPHFSSSPSPSHTEQTPSYPPPQPTLPPHMHPPH